jgi:hypothetical protein
MDNATPTKPNAAKRIASLFCLSIRAVGLLAVLAYCLYAVYLWNDVRTLRVQADMMIGIPQPLPGDNSKLAEAQRAIHAQAGQVRQALQVQEAVLHARLSEMPLFIFIGLVSIALIGAGIWLREA